MVSENTYLYNDGTGIPVDPSGKWYLRSRIPADPSTNAGDGYMIPVDPSTNCEGGSMIQVDPGSRSQDPFSGSEHMSGVDIGGGTHAKADPGGNRD